MHQPIEVRPSLDLTNFDNFSQAMTAALNSSEAHSNHHPVAAAMIGILAVTTVGGLIHSASESHNSSPVAVSAGNVGTSGNLLNASIKLDSATLVISAPESVTGPGGSGSCGFLTRATATERYTQNPNVPAQSKDELLSFMSDNPDRASKIGAAMEQNRGPLLDKIIPEGKGDALAYFKNMDIRRLDKTVTVLNTFCDDQGNVIKWRAETLAANTDVFTFIVKDGVFTRADGTTVKLSQADMASSIVVNQNGETLLVELKDPCNNVLEAPAIVVSPTPKPKEVTPTTAPHETTTSTPPTTVPDKHPRPPVTGGPDTTIGTGETHPGPSVPTTVQHAPPSTEATTPPSTSSPVDTRPTPPSTLPPATTPGVPTNPEGGGPPPSVVASFVKEKKAPVKLPLVLLPISIAAVAFFGSVKRTPRTIWKSVGNYMKSLQ